MKAKAARATAERPPSARSLEEMPEMDFARAQRHNPYAARIAREGYTVQIRRGRPRKGAEAPTKTKSVRFSVPMWSMLDQCASQEGLTTHAALREAVMEWASKRATKRPK